MIRTKILTIDEMAEIGPCSASDWAFNNGALQSKNLNEDGRPYTYVASSSPIVRETVDSSMGTVYKRIDVVKGIAPDGDIVSLECDQFNVAIQTAYRPALATPFKIDKKKKTISVDKYTLPLKRDTDGQIYFELGAYPQDVVSNRKDSQLSSLYSENLLKKTGNKYTVKYETEEEYELDGKRYVCLKGDWHEVTPIKWIVNGDKIYTDKALLGNIPFSPNVYMADTSYSSSIIYDFLRTNFDKQIMQSFDSVMQQGKDRSMLRQKLKNASSISEQRKIAKKLSEDTPARKEKADKLHALRKARDEYNQAKEALNKRRQR